VATCDTTTAVCPATCALVRRSCASWWCMGNSPLSLYSTEVHGQAYSVTKRSIYRRIIRCCFSWLAAQRAARRRRLRSGQSRFLVVMKAVEEQFHLRTSHPFHYFFVLFFSVLSCSGFNSDSLMLVGSREVSFSSGRRINVALFSPANFGGPLCSLRGVKKE